MSDRDPTMFVGVHGILRKHPWIDAVNVDEDGDQVEDTFSLAFKRAETYGWTSMSLGEGQEMDGLRWWHNDAGGDWTQDEQVREVAWLQAQVEQLRGQRLPLQPALTVLKDGLDRVGRLQLTGVHLVAPLHLATDSRFDLVNAADWFALSDPDAREQVTVTVSARGPGDLTAAADAVLSAAAQNAQHRMFFEAAPSRHAVDAPGVALAALSENVFTSGMRPALAFQCRAPEWSVDAAAWIAEIVLESLRQVQVRTPVLLTVSEATG
ncbi:hypothetical protein ABZ686_01350 [Streptomyces sp. NPDC006992]|uniref:hypothetical protein n=1 Tax=Streptomyces sp. NPDC006992 TaxID=3155601 RepID=UPI0033E54987